MSAFSVATETKMNKAQRFKRDLMDLMQDHGIYEIKLDRPLLRTTEQITIQWKSGEMYYQEGLGRSILQDNTDDE